MSHSPILDADGNSITSTFDGNPAPSTSLYVGDLDEDITDSQVYDIFSQLGQVLSVRVCRDFASRRSLGYAYVNFSNSDEAARALEVMNFVPVNGKPIRIMIANRDPSIRRSGSANIFIKNLDKSIDNKALYDTFSVFGQILSCKIASDASGESKGYGYVQFEQDEAAQNAIEKLNGMLLNDKQVFVGPFLRRQNRKTSDDTTTFRNVFVKNLSESATDEDLKHIFGEFGTITSAVIMRDGDGKSKCFGFVNFDNPDAAAYAVELLNGKEIDGKEWYVGKALKKSEREQELKSKFEHNVKESVDKYQGLNLYLKNLDDSIEDEMLKDLFAEFGTITSCKIMRDPNGISKGSGFVSFSTFEEASRALAEMNGQMVAKKPLYVAVAQRNEERRAKLQAQFSQVRPVAMEQLQSAVPPMSIYRPGSSGFGQQIFYGQAPPTLISQPGFGYQQPIVPALRHAGPPYVVPFVQQRQQGPRPGARRSALGHMRQHPPPLPPYLQRLTFQRGGGRMNRFSPGRSMRDMPIPRAVFTTRAVDESQPTTISELASDLSTLPPDRQRRLEHDSAPKVTGMLLEMDQTEVLHLLASPEALKAKVAEAMEVLRSVGQRQQQMNVPSDQLARLSLDKQ